MKTFKLRIFGHEIVALDLTEPHINEDQTEPDPAEPTERFGFHGGSGGSQQTTWQPTTPRPIDGSQQSPRL